MARDLLDDFTRTAFTAAGSTHDVYRAGSGPAVIVIAEMPGVTPKVADFARVVVENGFTVWMPSLFGRDGMPATLGEYLRSVPRTCVSREFAAFATNATAPVTTWLRALAAHAHDECGGPGVGAVGMCFTGGFALGMMVDEIMIAPVLSQPSLPLGLTKTSRASVHLAPADRAAVQARAAAGVCVLGLRFTGDPMCTADRFESLRLLLGDRFIGVEIDSSSGNAFGIGSKAHSVLTEDLVADDPTHPTAQALAQVIEFFSERLRPPPTSSPT